MFSALRSFGHWLCPLYIRAANPTTTPTARSVSRAPDTPINPIHPSNNQSINQSTDQSVKPPNYQSLSIDHSANSSNNQASYQTVIVNLDQPLNHSLNQSTNVSSKKKPLTISTGRVITQSTNQSFDQSVNQSIDQSDEQPLTPVSPKTLEMFKRSLINYSTSTELSRDINAYINHYPGQHDDKSVNDNLRFYRNELISKPDGDLVETIHEKWWGDYSRLEVHHGYIQWIFPIREPGMNYLQHPLQQHELVAIRDDSECRQRLLQSYRLMLDFYGFELIDESTGRLKRSARYKSRMNNLIKMSHNYLRISRILKCLGELGFEHLKLGFCLMLWSAARVKSGQSMRRSALDYWFKTLREQSDRDLMDDVIKGRREMSTFGQYRDLLKQAAAQRDAMTDDSDDQSKPPNSGHKRSLPENSDENEVPAKSARTENDANNSEDDVPPSSQSSMSTVSSPVREDL